MLPIYALVPFTYNDEVWKRLNQVLCTRVSTSDTEGGYFSIFPNPTTGLVRIKTDEPLQPFTVFNAVGQVIFNGQNLLQPIDLQLFKNGIYFIKLKNRVEKIIKL